MLTQRNKAVARRFYEILNSGELDHYREIMPDNFIDHNPVPGQAPGLAGVTQALADFRSAFPDLSFTIEDMIACEDKVVVRLVGKGTHKGNLMGMPPTGRKVEFNCVDIHRIANNRIMESWHIEDMLTVLLQVGALRLPAAAKA